MRTLAAALAVLLFAACNSPRAPAGPVDARADAPSDLGTDISPLDGSIAGYALSFDGTKDYATAGNGGFAPVGAAYSVELWVNEATASGTHDFVVLRTDFISGVEIGIHDGALAVWRVYVDRVLVQAPTAPAPGTWHHVAYTFDGMTNTLFLDGTAVDAQTNPTDTRTPTSAWIGTLDGSANLFQGKLDEVRVWTTARSAGEVAADMRHAAPGPQPGLVAYWTFDDAVNGGISADLSGSGNDVTLGDGEADRMPARVVSDAPVTE